MKSNMIFGIISTILLLVALGVTAVFVFAGGTQKVVYLSGNGSDLNGGTSAADAVLTLERAYERINGDGTVVICSDYTISKAELPASAGKVTLTSVYNGVDHIKSGASLVLGTDIYIGSDMTVENIDLSYSSAYKIFCQGHSVKFGEGITTSSSATAPAIFGGTNLSKTGVNIKNSQFFDFTLEICSGKWLSATCGSFRSGENTIIGVIGDASLIINGGNFVGKGTGDSDKNVVAGIAGSALHGDLYMEINGGTFSCSVFGAAACGMNGSRRIPGHLGDIRITVNGGSFNGTQLSAVQDKLNFVNGDYYLDIAGGVSFGSSVTMISAEAVDGTAYISCPSALESKLVDFGGNVYVSSSGKDTNSGKRSSPVATLARAAKLLPQGGRIVIMNSVTVGDTTLPEVDGDIIITGKFAQADFSSAAKLKLGGPLKLGTNTRIENLSIVSSSDKGSIDANGYDITLGADSNDLNVDGALTVNGGYGADKHTVTVNSGTYKEINGGSSDIGTAVMINGGAVTDSIFGADKSAGTATVEINGGVISADVWSADLGCSADVGICINGGTVNSDVLGAVRNGNVEGEFSLGIWGGEFSSSPMINITGAECAYASAASKYSSLISSTQGLACEHTVFCADGGEGDGKSPLSPVGSLAEASELIGADGGRIVVSDKLTVMYDETLMSKGRVYITSMGGGADFAVSRGARLEMSAAIILSSETFFDCIEFFASENNTYVSAECNRVEFGEHVVCSLHEGRGVEYPLSVYGGTYAQDSRGIGDLSTDVTIRSGNYYRVYGGNYRANRNANTLRTITGSIQLSIWGGSFSNAVCLNGMNNLTGEAALDIYGGTFKCPVFGMANVSPDINDAYGRVSGNITVNVWGGVFCGNLDASKDLKCSYDGVYTLNVYGGDLSRVTTIRGTEGMAGGSCSSVINCDRELNIDASLSGEIEFTNPIAGYADPSVQFDPDTGYYYYTYAGTYGGKQAIYVTRAPNLCDVGCSEPILIWTSAMQADGRGSELNSIWAPQINKIDGRWYIYATCAKGTSDSANRLPYVWVGGEAPTDPYDYHGSIDNYDPLVDIYLSPRLIEYGGQRYICNGGFFRSSDREGHQQSLFITKLKTPTEFDGDPVVIARPSRAYEDYKILEGPIGLVSPDGTLYLAYAAGHTRGQEYCTGLMRFTGTESDTLADASLWEKMEDPIHFVDYDSRVYSPGAMMFTTSPDGEQIWAVYHAKKYANTAYTMRRLYAQPLSWVDDYPVIEDPRPVDTVFTIQINSRSIASRISGFDKKKTVSTVFVAQGATGDGTCPDSPIGSLRTAYGLLGDHGGVIVICGRFQLTATFTEPEHSGTVIITQLYRGVDHSGGEGFSTGGVSRSYLLSGPTIFRDLKIATENSAGLFIVARYNPIEIGRGVECIGFSGESASASLTVLGGHNRSAGAEGTGNGGSCIVVKSGEGIFIAGADRYIDEDVTRDVSIEIYGGNIGKIYGGSINGGSCKNVSVKLFGGRYLKLIDLGCGVSGRVTLTAVNGNFESCPSVIGKSNASKATVYPILEDTLLSKMSEFDHVNIFTTVVYLSQGADGDGSSPDSPVGKLTSAYYALGDAGGVIVVMGDFVMESNFSAPAHTGRVTITSVYDGVDYSGGGAFSTGSKGKRYDLNGPTLFENITLKTASGQYLLIIANYNPIEIGEGVVCSGFTGTQVANSLSIIGGLNGTQAPSVNRDGDAHITVRSGSGILIAGLNRYMSERHSRNAVIDIYGGEIRTLYGGNINGGTGGGLTLNIYGGEFTGSVACADGIAGKIELIIYGGAFEDCSAISGSKSLSCFAYMRSETKRSITGIITDFRIVTEGDVDYDTKLSSRDITMLIRYLSGYSVSVKKLIADVNGDGIINNRDAVNLIRSIS